MADGTLRQIRRSQYISSFGVGAILDLGNESFIASDISKWDKNSGQVIHLKRLEYRLKVKEFRMPPVPKGFWDNNAHKLPYYRFPQWLFCPSCRKLTEWSTKREKKGELPRCENNNCRGHKVLVPMRFVMACENGHLRDIPWQRWAHSSHNVAEKGRCERNDLEFRSLFGKGGGLASLEIKCIGCGSSRSLQGIASKESMKSIGITCRGKQPWEFIVDGHIAECKQTPQVLQRGATNLYYPKTISALDIPLGYADPYITNLEQEIRSYSYFDLMVKRVNSATGDNVTVFVRGLAEEIAKEVNCDIQVVLDLAYGNVEINDNAESELSINEKDVLVEEWPILTNPPIDIENRSLFFAESTSLTGLHNSYGLTELIDKLVLVRRLREVRVLRGFHRISPGDEDTLVKADLDKHKSWLPGIEVFGEGIFISFSEQAIALWEKNHCTEIGKRLDKMMQRYKDIQLDYLPEPTPRFVMLHTFSHLLMRQLAFECGYSSSSLRERIYSAEPNSEKGPMAGVLIYTADADSEGSLGGLVRQGLPDRLIPTLLTALERGSWCSADPICRELSGQGLQGLNRAACHSCALMSETSCTCSNTLLDRMTVIGTDVEYGDYGFFAPVLSRLAKEPIL